MYTFLIRIYFWLFIDEDRRQRGYPGPGNYSLHGIHKVGRYYHSKHRNSKVRIMGKERRKGLDLGIIFYLYYMILTETCTPGPGSYNIDHKRLVLMSRVRNQTGIKIGNEIKDAFREVIY